MRSEELISHQRELQVLSQQFSLRCLENGHLVQALDAERKALCQCQQENQDLRTRNQVRQGGGDGPKEKKKKKKLECFCSLPAVLPCDWCRS